MANQITGTILKIGVEQVFQSKSGGADFRKRTVVLDTSRYDVYTGEKRENYASIEFSGKSLDMIPNFKEGDIVQVSFVLQGRKYLRDGVESFFTSIIGYKIEPLRHNPESAPQSPEPPQVEQVSAGVQASDMNKKNLEAVLNVQPKATPKADVDENDLPF